jgi:hypothetical protein
VHLPAAAALALVPVLASAAPRWVVSFDVPSRDATGPGTYAPPGDTQFRDGDFDLQKFAVLVDGDTVVFEVTLGATIRLPDVRNRDNSTPVQFLNGVYLQNVDIYLDTDRTPGSGVSVCIPGRRTAFAGGRTWESAVVITPDPGPTRAVLAESLGRDAARVVVAEGVLARGRTLVARVPAAALGGLPQPTWGYSVQVSGARWDRSYKVSDRVRDTREADAYTMPVTTVVEAWAFGGAPANSRAHPRVVDVLLPPGLDQKRVLSGFDVATSTYAKVPFVYADGPDRNALEGAAPLSAPAAAALAAAASGPSVSLPEPLRARPLAAGSAAPAPAGGWTVADVSGELVTIAGPTEGLAPLRIGRVLDAEGKPVAQLVVGRVLENGISASIVEGREHVVRGATVRFDPR